MRRRRALCSMRVRGSTRKRLTFSRPAAPQRRIYQGRGRFFINPVVK